MNEKILALLAKQKQGIALTQDEQDFLNSYNYNVDTIFGQKLNEQVNAHPIDIAYNRIKAGTATQNDIDVFNAYNEEFKKQQGSYKYDPSIGFQSTQSPQIFQNSTNYTPDFTKGIFPTQTVQDQPTQNIQPQTQTGVLSSWPAVPTNAIPTNQQEQVPTKPNSPQENIIVPSNDRMPTWEEKQKMENKGTFPSALVRTLQNIAPEENAQQGQTRPYVPYIFPGGSDLNTELYTLGRAIGAKDGQKGKLATGIFAGGAAALDMARNIASGVGYEKMNQYVDDWYRKNKNKVDYTPESQTRNENNQGKEGGIFHTNYFEMGGEQPVQQEEQIQETAQPQQSQVQQMMAGIAQAIQKGTPPEQIVQALMQQGLDQAQAIQLVQQVIQQMQGEQTPTTKDGKAFNAQPGQEISFMYGGKKVTGKIKEIRNGKVILE